MSIAACYRANSTAALNRVVVMELLLFLARALPRRRQNGARAGTGHRRSHTRCGINVEKFRSRRQCDTAVHVHAGTTLAGTRAAGGHLRRRRDNIITRARARASGLSGYRVAVIRFRP